MKNIFIKLLVTIVVLSFNSCNNFLDEVPDNRTEIDNIDKVKSLLVSAYIDKIPAAFLEPRTDGIIDHGATAYGPMSSSFHYNYSAFMWEEYPSISSGEDAEQYWAASYSAIAATNHALEAIEKLGTPKESLVYKGEALLARAHAHFSLLTIYSNFFDEKNKETNMGIPYVTKAEEVTNGQYDRGTVASTIELIKKDIDEGLKLSGETSDFLEPKFHFTHNAGLALALRVALYERRYNDVISLASNFFGEVSDYKKLYYGDKNPPEPILNQDGSETLIPSPYDITFKMTGSLLYNWSYITDHSSGVDAIGISFTNSDNENIILASEPYSLLDRTSISNTTIRYTHSSNSFSEITGKNASGVEWKLPLYTIGSAATTHSPAFLPKSYEDFKTTDLNAGSGIPYIRYSTYRTEEILLARAEAYAMIGEYDKALADLTMFAQNRVQIEEPHEEDEPVDDKALYALAQYFYSRDKVVNFYETALSSKDHYLYNTFNDDRFVNNDPESYEAKLQRGLVLSVLDARRMEFIYEGTRWFDILRWNIPVTHTTSAGLTSTLTPDDNRRVVQVPETVTLSGLKKNPFQTSNTWK